jgi:hypothetical protein
MGEIIDYLLGVLMEDYRDPLNRNQIFELRKLPYLEMRSGILGRRIGLDSDVKTVRIYFNDRCVAKAYGSRVQPKTSRKKCPDLDAICEDVEQTILKHRQDGFSRVLKYPGNL